MNFMMEVDTCHINHNYVSPFYIDSPFFSAIFCALPVQCTNLYLSIITVFCALHKPISRRLYKAQLFLVTHTPKHTVTLPKSPINPFLPPPTRVNSSSAIATIQVSINNTINIFGIPGSPYSPSGSS